MIRATIPEDTADLATIAESTGVFLPGDVQALRDVLDAYHAEAHSYGHECVTYLQDGRPIGFAYFAPVSMTDRTWELWWIAVSKLIQAKGVGATLLAYVEEAIRKEDGRLIVLDTSSLPSYDLTRRFYLKQGYDVIATIKDYYGDGHDKVMFGKRVSGKP
jgi:ribosomal protein S18 acetylase RimI-like enzyme